MQFKEWLLSEVTIPAGTKFYIGSNSRKISLDLDVWMTEDRYFAKDYGNLHTMVIKEGQSLNLMDMRETTPETISFAEKYLDVDNKYLTPLSIVIQRQKPGGIPPGTGSDAGAGYYREAYYGKLEDGLTKEGKDGGLFDEPEHRGTTSILLTRTGKDKIEETTAYL